MKKVKKFLCLLSVMAVMAAGTISASADYIHNYDPGIDFDNVTFSTKVYTSEPHYLYSDSYYYSYNSQFAYNEFFIDKKGVFCALDTLSRDIVVKMKDGAEPPKGYKNASGENLIVKEFTTYQKAVLKNKRKGTWAYVNANIDDIELTDNVYLVSGLEGGYKTVSEYCEKLLESGTVELAVPLLTAKYDRAEVIGVKEFKEAAEIDDMDVDRFMPGDYLFALSFENAEQAESFDTGSVEGFEEKLYAMQVIDNDIFFQFKDSNDGLGVGRMLSTLQNTKPIKRVYCVNYRNGRTEEDSEQHINYINGVPEPYEMGDLNFDKKIDLLDVISLSKGLVSRSGMSEDQRIIADFDCNGKVELLDAIGIAKYIIKN